MNILVVVDMQNDFIDGSLGTEEAQRIVPEVVKKIQTFDGTVFATRDTHEENYLETAEGKKLPVRHCIRGTEGWQIRQQRFFKEDIIMSKEKVVLAYSGGLDTTAIIPWLKENFDYEVICCCIDCGQGEADDDL